MKMNGQSSPYYPVSLNVRGRKCVVVGGGQVALRKVRTLLEHGANVDVISPELCPELGQLADRGSIHICSREYQEEDLVGAFIVIAATDDGDVNRRVVDEARRKAIMINVVDDADTSDFIAPSYLQRGDITIAVSTAGRSPALARKIRTVLEKDFTDEYASLAQLVGEVRDELKQQGIQVDGEDWQEALQLDSLIELLRHGETEKARSTLIGNLTRQNAD
jgi:siroheme synthase-like protein